MIKQHKAEPMQASKWSFSFALSLTKLGDMQATVSLIGNYIDVKINAQQSSTLDILNNCQNEIKQLIEKSGLNLRDWLLQLGLDNNQIDVASLHLLDIRI